MRMRFFLLSIMFFVLSNIWAEEKKPEYILKMGTLAPEGSIYMELLHEFWDRVYNETGGRVKVVFYPGGIMGDEPDMVKKLQFDQLQMGAFTSQGVISIAPAISVMELPFMFESLEEVDYIRSRMFRTFSKSFEDRGFFLLAFVDQGGFLNFYSVNPIQSIEDFRKEKVWAWAAEPVGIELLKSIGISPVTTPVPEVLPGLQTGLLSVVNTSPLACVSLQWHSKIRYIILLNFRYAVGAVVITNRAWKMLPEDIQTIILKINKEMTSKMINAIRLSSNKSLMAMAQQGIEIIKWREEEKNRIKERMQSIYDKLADNLYPGSILNEIQGYLVEYRKGN